MTVYLRGTALQLAEGIQLRNMKRLNDANLEQFLGRLALLQRWAQSELELRKRQQREVLGNVVPKRKPAHVVAFKPAG